LDRAATSAGKYGVSREFVWVELNYRSLVPWLRAMMTPEGLCLGCGHAFEDQGDIQIEHTSPPRFAQDWARLHTRNLRLMCASCNGSKGQKEFDQWLDDEEERRLSNKCQPSDSLPIEPIWMQNCLFADLQIQHKPSKRTTL
jgi:hypothetical protein